MSSHTLTFSADLYVTVDGVEVTSPYNLTENCTIVAVTTNGSYIGSNFPNVEVNNSSYTENTTLSLSTIDIDVLNSYAGITSPTKLPNSNISITINYTA